ncbi:MAG: transposase DNA-binding-containing protein, partial [Phycisphaerae bacterium]
MQASRTTALSFGEEHFGRAELGDERRTKRLVVVADRMAEHPGGTLPDKLREPAGLKALYRLMDSDAVTHEAVLQPHVCHTLDRMRAHEGVVLVLHDTTELDYTNRNSLKDELGQIGNGSRRGYECHNSLAVTAESREVLGLTNQILFRRPHVGKGETRAARRRRKTRESRLWKQGSQPTPAAPAGRLWVDVADRGADTLEFLDFEEAQGKKYVVRSQHNRRVLRNHDGESEPAKLHDLLRSLPEEGRRTVDVPARNGRPARTATVGVAWAPVRILPPRQPRGDERGTLLAVWAVRVWELDPPADVDEP